MRRRRRLFVLPVLFLLAPLLHGCHQTKVTNPGEGPGTGYPCGYHGTSCVPFDGTKTCCGEGERCANDGEPYCEGNLPDDPSDPAQWSRKLRPRLKRWLPSS